MKYIHAGNTTRRLRTFLVLGAAVGSLHLPLAALAQGDAPTGPAHMHKHGETLLTKFMLDSLELRDSEPDRTAYWEAQAWIGGDINKLWLKTEGEANQGRTRDAEIEALYSRAVAPYWDVQAGVRHDLQVNGMPSRDWLAIGLKGLAPYMFDIDVTGYIGDSGRSAARVKAEYNLLVTQRLVLMPEFEANLYGKQDAQRELGSGLSSLELGLRLRYDIRRKFSPYVGVVWTRLYGDTASHARQNGETVQDTQLVAGLRAWW
jgi:copper resistance protein B